MTSVRDVPSGTVSAIYGIHRAVQRFDRAAATSALNTAAGHAAGCKTPGGPTGQARVTATFAPSGKVTNAVVAPPFAGTASGECIAKAFKNASVAPFEGQPVPMSKAVTIR